MMPYIPVFGCCILIILDLVTRQRGGKMAAYTAITIIALSLAAVPPFFLTGIFAFTAPRFILCLLAIGYLCLRLIMCRQTQSRALNGLGIYYNLSCIAAIIIMLVLAVSLPGSILYSENLLPCFILAAGILFCGPFGIIILIGLSFSLIEAFLANWPLVIACVLMLLIAGTLLVAAPVFLGVRAALAAARELSFSKRERVFFVIFMVFPFLNTITMFILQKRIANTANMQIPSQPLQGPPSDIAQVLP